MGGLRALVVILPAAVTLGNLSAWSMSAGGFSLLLPSLVALFAAEVLPSIASVEVLKRCVRRATSPTVLFACLFAALSMTTGLANAHSPDAAGVAYDLTSGLVVFVVYYVFVFSKPGTRGWTLWGLVIGGLLLAVNGLQDYAGLLWAQDTYVGVRAAGYWGDPNTFAYALVLSSAAAWTLSSTWDSESDHRPNTMRLWYAWALLAVLTVFAVGVVASVSRSGLLVLAAVTVCSAPLIRRLGYPAVIPLCLAVLAVGFALWNPFGWHALEVMDPRRLLQREKAGSERLNVLWHGLYAFAESPLTGGGYDASFRWSEKLLGTGVFSHNQVVEILASGGLVTFFPWLALMLLQFREALRPSRGPFPVLFLVWLVCVTPSAHFLMYHSYTWVGLALCSKEHGGGIVTASSLESRERSGKLYAALVVPQFYPVVGGAEAMVRYIAGELQARGHGVTVVTLAPAGMEPGLARVDDVTVVRLADHPKWPGPLRALAFWGATAAWIYRHREQLTVVHAHQFYAATGPCLTRRLHGVPVILHLHGGGTGSDRGKPVSEYAQLQTRRLGRWRARSIVQGTDLVLAAAPSLAAELQAAFPDVRARWFPNGVDGKRFTPPTQGQRLAARDALGLERRAYALYIGRLTYAKGADRLLRLWADGKRTEEDPWPELIVCGTGELQTDYRLATALNPTLHYVGSVDDVRPFLWAADFLVLPSRYEGLPVALLEAMACGLPAVAADVGAVSKAVVDRETGLLVPPAETSFGPRGPFAAAVRSMVSNPELRVALGRGASERFTEFFELETMVTRLLNWYYHAAANSDGRGDTATDPVATPGSTANEPDDSTTPGTGP